ncbi:type II secretion system protein N [Caenimonas terrae]|uniref:Type II secretion system protein N n=1 Tax=Caenimonas terrae TaxID=696074 RepID=A0ABW0NAN4_9BURK
MATSVQSRWPVRLATLILWLLAAGSCVYWALRMAPRAAPAAVAAPVRQPFAADPAAVARLLGASPVLASAPAQPSASLASRFSLLGVVAWRTNHGAALIAVDGKPPRPFRVGSAIDEGLVLQSVEGRKAVLAAAAGGPPVLTLELPPLKR